MEERRGRPKEIKSEDKPRKWSVTTVFDDGVKSTFIYDLDIFPNGPIEVNIDYPENYVHPSEQLEEDQENLPLTKRKYINPANGKLVGYTRAKNLGII